MIEKELAQKIEDAGLKFLGEGVAEGCNSYGLCTGLCTGCTGCFSKAP